MSQNNSGCKDDTGKMTRRNFVGYMGMASSAAILSAIMGCNAFEKTGDSGKASGSAANRPNIIFILSDDLGWADVSYHGSSIPTPNIDRLAREGVDLSRHYVAPVCSPTRAGLLTGRCWSRFGITVPSSRQCLPDRTPTIASQLKEAGYRTALIGKWHLGGAEMTNKRPGSFGFDYTYGSLDGAVHPYTHVYTPGGKEGDDGQGIKTWHRNGKIIEEKGHTTDLIANEAIRFVENSQNAPFFLYLPFTAPHGKCIDTQEWMDKCAHIPEERRSYAAMVAHMDDAIGKLVATLDRLGLRENTLIVFSSDNGGVAQGLNTPLRKKKAYVYEGGVRAVAFANWPGKLKPSTLQQPICITDWMPTFCALARADSPANVDGKNIWTELTHPSAPVKPRPIYLLGVGGRSSALIMGEWKLVHSEGGTELYNVVQDPSETKDLASAYPDRVKELEQLLSEAARNDKDSVAPELAAPSKPEIS